MSPEVLILAAMAAPLVGGVLLVAAGEDAPNLRETCTLVTAVVTFALVAVLFPVIADGGRPEVTLLEMLPGLSITFRVEPLGMLFAGIASFLWIVTSFYAIGYMRGHGEANQTRFYFFFAVAISSAIGIAYAGNMLTLFVFYEVLTLSTYPLVTHAGTDEAKKGGRVYLGILIFTSITFLLFGMIWTYVEAGTLDFQQGGILADASGAAVGILFALYIYGIGKAALMPFHRWLPSAMVAPTPVSALLHAVAVVKAGVFSVLKVTIYVFGLDTLQATGASNWLAWVAAATILLASLVAMGKDNLKARLAYSTVSQLSYIVLGAMVATSLGVVGGAMHIAMHAFGKITLFFCAGAIMVAHHKTEISQMTGLGRKMPLTFICFAIGSLSIIGLPPLGGMWSKWYLALGAADADQLIFVAVLMISSLLNIAYLLPIPINAFMKRPEDASDHGHAHHEEHDAHHGHVDHPSLGIKGVEEAPALSLGALTFTAVGCLVLFFYADELYRFLLPIVDGGTP